MTDADSFRIRQTAIRIGVLNLGLVAPLIFSLWLEDGFELPQILGALCALVFLFLVLKASDWTQVFGKNRSVFFLVLALLGVSAYSFHGLAQGVSFYFSTQTYLWILAPLLFLAPVGFFLDKRKFYAALVFSGLLGSLYACAQALGLDLGGWSTHFGGRSFSTLGNPVFWAGHLLVLLPLALHLALSAKGKREEFFWWAAGFSLIISLLETQTRGAWLGFLAEAAFLALLSWRRSSLWKWMMVGMIGFLLAILFIPSLSQRAITILHPDNQDAQGRYFLWKVALKQWRENPWLGQGPGGYANHFHQTQAELSQEHPGRPFWTAFHTHEEYLELLADRGVVGAGLVAVILWMVIWRRIRGFQSVGAPFMAPEGMMNHAPTLITQSQAELAVLVGIGLQSLFNFPLSVVPTACALALLFNPSWGLVPVTPEKRQIGGEIKFLLGLGLVFVCGLGMKVAVQNARLHQAIDLNNGQRFADALQVLNFDPAIVFFHYNDPRVMKQKATALQGIGKFLEATELLEKVVQLYPYDADAYALLCMLYGQQKQWDKAEARGLKALDISPCHEQALNNLAVAAYLQGHKKIAVQYLSRLEQAEAYWGHREKAEEIHRKIDALNRHR